jgi:hypothetical protein
MVYASLEKGIAEFRSAETGPKSRLRPAQIARCDFSHMGLFATDNRGFHDGEAARSMSRPS